MWNHLRALQRRRLRGEVRRPGTSTPAAARRWRHRGPERAGVPVLGPTATITAEIRTGASSCIYTGPARRAGEALLIVDSLDIGTKRPPRVAVPAGPAPREARARPRRRHAEPGHRRRARRSTTRSSSTARWTASTSSSSARRRCSFRTTATSCLPVARRTTSLKPNHVNPDLRALGAAPRVGGRGDAEARQAPRLQQARLLPRRGQLGGARLRPVRRARPALPRRASPTWRRATTLPAPYTDMFGHYDLVGAHVRR